MANYMAMQIELKKLDYKTLFSMKKWIKYQGEVNSILVSRGKEGLIVP